MASYKLIAVDVDGTLLTSQSTISPRTHDALRHAIEQGAHLAVATGRRRRTALPIMAKLDLPHFLVASQGAAVWLSDRLIHHSHLPAASATIALEIIRQHGAVTVLFNNSLRDEVIWVDGDWRANERVAHYVSRNMEFVRPFDPVALEHDPIQFVVMESMERLELLNVALTGHRPPPPSLDSPVQEGLGEPAPLWRVIFSKNQFTAGGAIEVVGPTTSKASALEFLCRHLDITRSQVVAFGDNINDIEMLEFAGLGVAMGNGTDDAKAIADEIAPSNDEDGVAITLEKLGLA